MNKTALLKMCHDLNNHLGGIYGYSDMLIEEPLNEREKEMVEKIHRSVHKAAEIVSHMLRDLQDEK